MVGMLFDHVQRLLFLSDKERELDEHRRTNIQEDTEYTAMNRFA